MENNNVYWYELCFYGDEDTEGENYDVEKACSYVIKTEIKPVIDEKVALQILFGKNPEKEWMKELVNHCTCVMNISEDEAQFFDIDVLTKRIEDPDLGIYYSRE